MWDLLLIVTGACISTGCRMLARWIREADAVATERVEQLTDLNDITESEFDRLLNESRPVQLRRRPGGEDWEWPESWW